jgi:hypothetical protein
MSTSKGQTCNVEIPQAEQSPWMHFNL